jgi:hypothetical protein
MTKTTNKKPGLGIYLDARGGKYLLTKRPGLDEWFLRGVGVDFHPECIHSAADAELRLAELGLRYRGAVQFYDGVAR